MIFKLVIDGGPCSGKTSIMSILEQELTQRGWKVIIVPETATTLITNGIKPDSCLSNEIFQELVLEQQLQEEELFLKAAGYYGDKVIVIHDRGALDGLAYLDKESFDKILKKKNLTIQKLLSRYDGVLHLVTAANGAEKFYQWNDPTKEDCGNNAARGESPEKAREIDEKTKTCYLGNHLRVIDNSSDFKGKVDRALKEIFAMLGEPTPTEIERKFLIKRPTIETLNKIGCCSKDNIIQTYLISEKDGTERRVRQRGNENDGYTFYFTEKTPVKFGERIEKERKISIREYTELLTQADINLHQILKNRYCFVYNNQYFELDVYPFSEEYAILEIELNDINEKIDLPEFITIVKEVTNDERYSNFSLAKTMELK